MNVCLDESDLLTAEALLPRVRREVPLATRDYVVGGAIGVGLNRICGGRTRIDAATLARRPVQALREVDIVVDPKDIARAEAASERHGIVVVDVLSAAARTGLAMLSGVDTVRGAAAAGN